MPNERIRGPLDRATTLYLVEACSANYPDAPCPAEWQLSDGPAGNRSYSEDFSTIEEALDHVRVMYPDKPVQLDLMPAAQIEAAPLFDKRGEGFFDDLDDRQIGYTTLAHPDHVAQMLAAPVGLDGRGEWRWFRFADSTLVFGCYPSGDTYKQFSDAGVCDFEWVKADEPESEETDVAD